MDILCTLFQVTVVALSVVTAFVLYTLVTDDRDVRDDDSTHVSSDVSTIISMDESSDGTGHVSNEEVTQAQQNGRVIRIHIYPKDEQ